MIAKFYQKICLLFARSKNRCECANSTSRKRNLCRQRTVSVIERPILLASVLITALLLEVRQFDGLETLELAVFDQMVRLQPLLSFASQGGTAGNANTSFKWTTEP